MTQTAWHHLPNAKLIDQVLAELRANPEVFVRAWDVATYAATYAVRSADRDAARNADRVQAWHATWHAARDVPGSVATAGDRNAARAVARYAIVTFIAYDDSPKYLDMTYEELQSWAILSEHPATVLLLPYVWVREQLSKARA